MIFSIIILVVIGSIAFFHYVQGFLSATLSAFLAVTAAVLAVSYHEPLAALALKGKAGDMGTGLTLMVLFAALYFIPKTIFDILVPGNIRFPAIVDKAGAAVMGLIAGVYAAGILAVAAQTFPFGPTIGGYGRYKTGDERAVIVQLGNRRGEDTITRDELNSDEFTTDDARSLLIPVDDILLGTVQHLSDGGSLEGDQKLSDIHPDYLQELFGGRLGIQPGAKHVAISPTGKSSVSVEGVYSLQQIPEIDGELASLRNPPRKVPNPLKPTANQVLLVVRVVIAKDAGDDIDHIFRFSPGSIHLVAGDQNDRKDYYPIGTIDSAKVMYANRVDDYLFAGANAKGEYGIDLAFLVDRSDIVQAGKDKDAAAKVKPGTFIAVKRGAEADLSGMKIETDLTESSDVKMLRKPSLAAEVAKATGESTGDSDNSPR